MKHSVTVFLLLCAFSGLVHAKDIFVAPTGSDSNSGTSSAPKRTIQAAIDAASAGDRVIVRPGSYTERNSREGDSYPGIQVTRSGITIMSETPGAAIIDQNYEAAGLVLRGSVSDVTISGFSIRQCLRGGVYMTNSSKKRRIVVDGNTITGCDGPSGSNVGGVYMASCSDCVISNNTISNIRVGGVNYQNAAGIHGYDQEMSVIEGNTIFDAHNGVFHKRSTGAKGLTIRRNVIRNVRQGIWYSVSGSGDPPHIDQEVYENVISASENCIRASARSTSSQSRGLFVKNNVLTGCKVGVVSGGVRNIVVQNNIFFDTDNDIVTREGSWRNELAMESHNVFHPSMRIVLQQYADETNVSSLSAWRPLSGFGEGSIIADPQFAAPSSGNYTLRASSPAKNAGSDGRDIGAFPGGEVTSLPMPPATLVVD